MTSLSAVVARGLLSSVVAVTIAASVITTASAQSTCGVVVRGAPDDALLASAIEARLASECTVDSGGARAGLTFLAPDAAVPTIDVVERTRTDAALTTLVVVSVAVTGEDVAARIAIATASAPTRIAFAGAPLAELTSVLVARTSALLHEAPPSVAPPVAAPTAAIVVPLAQPIPETQPVAVTGAAAPSTTLRSRGLVVHPVVAAPEPWPEDRPDEVRVVLGLVAAGPSWGGGVALRIDVGLYAIERWSALSLGIDLMALAGWSPFGDSGVVRIDTPLSVTGAWRILAAPHVEIAPRAGISVSVPYERLLSNEDWQAGVAIRAVAGAFIVFRTGSDAQFLIGLDVHFGAGEIVALTLGMRQ